MAQQDDEVLLIVPKGSKLGPQTMAVTAAAVVGAADSIVWHRDEA